VEILLVLYVICNESFLRFALCAVCVAWSYAVLPEIVVLYDKMLGT